MKSIVQTNIERRVKAESEKSTLIDSYGNIIGWMKVLADWLLAPAGAILDGLVLFGIFFLAVKVLPLAVILAAIAAIAIQFFYGKPASHAAATVFTGRYQKEGEQKLMWGMWGLTLFGLSASLALSFQSDKLVEAVGEQYYQQETDEQVQARYDTLLQQAQQQHNTDVATLQQRINTLQQDKIMWKGQLTTRERSSRKAAALSEELTTLQQAYNTRVAQVEEQRNNSLQQLQQRNNRTATLFASRIDEGGATLKGINIAFNLARFCIIVLFMYFVAKAAEEQAPATATTPVATTVAARNNNTATPATPARLAPAATTAPEPERTRVQPFRQGLPRMEAATLPQQPTTPVATTVVASSATPASNTYNVTVVDGEPTLPPPAMMNTKATAFTLSDVKSRIHTYKSRNSENGKAIYRELLSMQAILEKEKS